MKAIILAAGLGTRLRPMTENTPKALVKVNQKPLVEYQIEFLKERGIDEITCRISKASISLKSLSIA